MKIGTVGDNCIDSYKEMGKAFPGGNPVNVAVYFVRLGGEASYVGVVGDDEYGPFMTESIARKGVDTSYVHTLPGKTAVTEVKLVDGDRIMAGYDEGVLADFKLNDEDIDFLAGHDLVVSSVYGNVHDSFKDIRAKGVKLAFDASDVPEREASKVALKNCDYFFYSNDDGDTDEVRAQMKSFKEEGPELVICMQGDKGSIVYDGSEYHKFGIVPCEVIDTIGAGDSYIAGFLKGILEGKAIEEAMKIGAANASETIGYFGAWEVE